MNRDGPSRDGKDKGETSDAGAPSLQIACSDDEAARSNDSNVLVEEATTTSNPPSPHGYQSLIPNNNTTGLDFNRHSFDVSEDVAKCLEEMDADLNDVDEQKFSNPHHSQPSIYTSSLASSSEGKVHQGLFSKENLPFSRLFRKPSAETLVFASRISISATVASLFLLAFPLGDPYYQSIWIFMTTSIVAWQPSIDAGTTFKKFLERFVGTIVGALLAFAVGYLSLCFRVVKDQAIFLGFAFAIQGFLYPYIADRLGYRSSYGAFLGNLTFGLAVYGFYNQQDAEDPYKPALFRVVNVVIGCAIVGVVSLVVYPVSTKTLMIKNVKDLVAATGRSTEMILAAASISFETGRKPLGIVEVLWAGHATSEADQVYNMYIKNMDGWKNCRLLIPTLKYDPWFLLMDHDEKRQFKHFMITQVARTFRVQLNAVMLDSIMRSDVVYRGPSEALVLFREIGATIRKVLDCTVELDERQRAVKMLLETDLPQLRSYVATVSDTSHVSTKLNIAHLESMLLSKVRALPLSTLDTHGEQTLLFFQMTEQLILRVARLHFSSLKYDIDGGGCVGCRI